MNMQMSTSRREILDAAAICFMELGVRVASLDDIAHRLGATKGRIYHHFPSKAALLGEVRLWAPEFTRRAVEPVIDNRLPPERNFQTMARTHVRAVLDTLPYHKVVLQNFSGMAAKSNSESARAMESRILRAVNDYEDLFRTVVRQGMDSGAFARRNLSVTLHSTLILLNAPVFWYAPRSDEPAGFADLVANQLADMGLAALVQGRAAVAP